jgi:hypothetical protein
MPGKHVVCDGAICQCIFGANPDKLKVKSQDKEFINDKDGNKKYVATHLDIGATVFEKNTFGPCQMQPLPSGGNKTCQPVVQEWKGPYKNLKIGDSKAQVLVEDSTAICPIGGTDCIKITFHGQVNAPAPSAVKKANKEVLQIMNPVVAMADFEPADNTPNFS